MNKGKFDYETKLWGAGKVRLKPTYLGALRLSYCLEDLKGRRGKVLEAGCGGGGMAKAIKFYRPDLEVYGCDISKKAIMIACRKPEGVKFLLGDIYNLPFKNESFDGVVSFDLLEHLEEPPKALKEVYRVLKPGGIFHSYVPCEGNLFTLHGILAVFGWQAKEKYGGHLQRFTRGQLKDILKTAKLLVVKMRWSGHFFNQLVDIAYFNLLALRGKNVPFSIETYLEEAKPGFYRQGLKALKATIAFISYAESKFLSWLPGAGVHFLAIKKYEKTDN